MNLRSLRWTLTLTIALLGLASGQASADGELEINQTCAVNTGCFSGDTAGFPVTIDGTAGYSYVLTSDLTVTGVNDQAVTLAADGLSIDLNGFQISGPVTCTGAGTTLSCSGSGTGSGVGLGGSGTRYGLSVRNGSIVGMGRFGVHLGRLSEARDLHIRWSGLDGINAGNGAKISDSIILQNGQHGIKADADALIERNVVSENADDGINVTIDSHVRANKISRNGEDGIHSERTLIHDNSITSNTGWGLNWKGTTPNGFRGNLIQGNSLGNVPATVLFNDLGGNLY